MTNVTLQTERHGAAEAEDKQQTVYHIRHRHPKSERFAVQAALHRVVVMTENHTAVTAELEAVQAYARVKGVKVTHPA